MITGIGDSLGNATDVDVLEVAPRVEADERAKTFSVEVLPMSSITIEGVVSDDVRGGLRS